MARNISFIVLAALVLALAILFVKVMFAFLLPLFLALLLSILFRPLYLKLVDKLRGHDRVAAALMTTLILVIVLAPVGFALFRAAVDLVQFVHGSDGPKLDRDAFEGMIDRLNGQFDLQISSTDVMKNIAGKANEWFGPVAAKTPGFIGGLLLDVFVMIFALYYFLADGDELVASSSKLVPLDQKYQRQLLTQFVEISRAVTAATLLTALVQGVAMMFGYWMAGFDAVVLLMILTVFAGFVPVVGSAAVWLPCCAWLLFADRIPAAVVLGLYCTVVVVLADNIMKPMILHGQSNIHPLLALLSILGGVEVMGPMGIFVGPMAVAFLQSGLKMLNVEIQHLRERENEPKK